MLSKVILFPLSFIPLISIVISCHATVKSREEEKEVILRIQSDKEVYQESEKIPITFEFTNNNNQPISLIRNMFSLGQPGLTLYWRSNGLAINSLCRLGVPEKEGISMPVWQIIKPGETYNTTMTLEEINSENTMMGVPRNLRFLPPNTYDIYASYEFNEDNIKAMGITINKTDESVVWVGKIVSNMIKITIKPKGQNPTPEKK